MRFGDTGSGPALLDNGGPKLCVVWRVAFHTFAGNGRASAGIEEFARGTLQGFGVIGQIEIHAVSLAVPVRLCGGRVRPSDCERTAFSRCCRRPS